MPLRSKAQARFLASKHPRLFKEFARKTANIKNLPDKRPHNTGHNTGHKTSHN